MTIGIITFSDTNDNYGQMLQCWALQETLIRLGHNPYIIRYENHGKNEWKRRLYKIAQIYPLFLYLKQRVRVVSERSQMRNLIMCNQRRRFDEFRSGMLRTTPIVYHSLKEIQRNPPVADCYIAGSDSIWAQLLDNRNNRVWFLDFGNPSTKRISYAASFLMSDYPVRLKPVLKNLLSRFSSISVREVGGAMICKDLGLDVEITCDPTLLLTKLEYKKSFIIDELKRDEIYLYLVNIKDKEDLKWDELYRYVKETDNKIRINVGSGIYPGYEIYGEDVEYDYCTIDNWLNNINNAKCVVTSSFHGVVFSIIQETPFIYVPFIGKRARLNNRIIELLSLVGLTNRVITEDKHYQDLFEEPIDWTPVRKNLDKIRKKSIDFIVNAL